MNHVQSSQLLKDILSGKRPCAFLEKDGSDIRWNHVRLVIIAMVHDYSSWEGIWIDDLRKYANDTFLECEALKEDLRDTVQETIHAMNERQIWVVIKNMCATGDLDRDESIDDYRFTISEQGRDKLLK